MLWFVACCAEKPNEKRFKSLHVSSELTCHGNIQLNNSKLCYRQVLSYHRELTFSSSKEKSHSSYFYWPQMGKDKEGKN